MTIRKLLRALSAALGLTAKRFSASDGRGRRFVAVIECALNQNVRDAGAARFPAMNWALLQLCHVHGVGILPLACPEVAVLGAQRMRPPGLSLRAALDSAPGQRACRAQAAAAAATIAERIAHDARLLAIVGGNRLSPGCAVHQGAAGLSEASGVFMQALQGELRERGIDPPFIALRDAEPASMQADLAGLAGLLAAQRATPAC